MIRALLGRLRRLRLPALALAVCALTGCAEFTKDAETALKVLGEANTFGTNAATWLDQYESAIVDLAPSSDRALLQVDLDKGRADLQAALTAGADVSKMTEDALLKNYAAFIADAEKLATDAEQAGLFKAPAASSNAVAAGASPPPAPVSSPPPLPLVVLRAKGQV